MLVRQSHYKLEWMPECWPDVQAAGDWLIELERETQPDVVHLNGYAHGRWPFISPTLVVAHSCVLSWWSAVRRESAPRDWDRYRTEVSAGLRSADRVIAPTRAMLAMLKAHYGPLPTAAAIYNGCDPSRFQRAGAKAPFVLSAGRLWDDAKNIRLLDQAAPRVPWPIKVAGERTPPDGSASRREQNVVMLGQQDQAAMARLLAQASIYCLPARYEPFGLSILEAAMSGCALVVGDLPTLREVWEDAAIYVQPDDAEALALSLRRLIDDPAERESRARQAQARSQLYTAATMAERYVQLYRELTSRARNSLEFAVPPWDLPPTGAAIDEILEKVWTLDGAQSA